MNSRVQQALRISLSVTVAALLGFALHVDDPYWAVITIFVLSTAHVESTWTKTSLRILGTFGGAALGLCFAALCANHREAFLATLFAVTALGSYFFLTSRHPYAWMLGTMTYYMVTITSTQFPGAAWDTAFWRCFEVLLGSAVLVFVGFFFFPSSAASQVQPAFSALAMRQTELFQLILRGLREGVLHGEEERLAVARVEKALRNVDSLFNAVRSARAYRGMRASAIQALFARHNELFALSCELLEVFRHCGPDAREGIERLPIGELESAFSKLIVQADATLRKEAVATDAAMAAVAHFRAALEPLRKERVAGRFALPDASLIHEISTTATGILRALDDIFLIQAVQAEVHYSLQPTKRGFSQLRASFSTRAVKQSIKVALSAVLTMACWFLTDWYGARVGLVSALIVGAERNMYYTARKAVQRIGGNVLGAVIGIACLSFFVSDLFSETVALLVGAYLFGYLAAGPPSIYYFGFQAGLAFTVALVSSDQLSPSTDLPVERVAGVLLGSSIATLVSFLLWPVSPYKDLDVGLGKAFQLLGSLIERVRGGAVGASVDSLRIDGFNQHSLNAQGLDSTQDAWREACGQIEASALLMVASLSRRADVDSVKEALVEVFDVDSWLGRLQEGFEHAAAALSERTPLPESPAQLEAEHRLLVGQISALRKAQTIQRMAADLAGQVVITLRSIEELHRLYVRFADLYEKAPCLGCASSAASVAVVRAPAS